MKIDDSDLANVIGGTKIPYRVVTGDTLGAIAKRFNVTIEQLCQWNNISDPNKLSVNQLLYIKY